jgi:hypothetical protein
MRKRIRSAQTPADAIAFCVEEHRHGGSDVQLARSGGRHLAISGLAAGRPERGLHVWTGHGGELVEVIPWLEVVRHARIEGRPAVAVQCELPL